MKWNVILQDTTTGKFQPYNIFEYRDFRLSMENLFKKQYPEERFLKELDLEIHYFFWAKIEWEIFITACPPYIGEDEINRIIETAKKHKGCLAPVSLLIFAGIRPREVRRLKWNDINLSESYIKVRSQCSKTGGVRHVEVCNKLKHLLSKSTAESEKICPSNWNRRWQNIRNTSGFKGKWQQDVLRHTYASYHAKHFQDLPRLQLNMGHQNQSLLRSRYINMNELKSADSKYFFCSSVN